MDASESPTGTPPPESTPSPEQDDHMNGAGTPPPDDEAMDAVSQEGDGGTPVDTTGDGGSEWAMYYNDEGTAYYYNSVTGMTQWEAPDDFDPDAAAAAADTDAGNDEQGDEVEASTTPRDTEDHQSNSVDVDVDAAMADAVDGGDDTKEQTTTQNDGTPSQTPQTPFEGGTPSHDEPTGTPVAGSPGEEAATGEPESGETGAEAVSGPAWTMHHDDEGREYYYNSETGVTQWEKPDDFVPYEEPMEEAQADGVGDTQTEGGTETAETLPESASANVALESEQKESEPSPIAEEIDTRDPHEIAIDVLKQPDSIVEYKHKILWNHINEVIKAEGQSKGIKTVMSSLVANYVSQPAICGLLASWLTKMKASNSASSSTTPKPGPKFPTSSAKTLETSINQYDDSIPKSIRNLMEQVISKQAQTKFTKSVGDAFLQNFTEEEAKFLEDMMRHKNWRRLLIDLSAQHKDSSLLGYCLSEISKKGHHREISKRIDLSDYFEVFHRMLKSELIVLGCGSTNSSNEEKDPRNDDQVVKDLLRSTCTSTEYTYLYSLEMLNDLISKAKGKKSSNSGQEHSLKAVIRIWQRLREDLDAHMIKPSTANSMNPLTRKRRADLALTVSELHQRQRRRHNPNAEDAPTQTQVKDNVIEKRRYSIDSGIIGLLKKFSMGMDIDDGLAEQLLHNPYEVESPDDDKTGGRLGQLLVNHPLAVKALIQSLFHPTCKLKSLEMKLKASKLISIAILASQHNLKEEGDIDDAEFDRIHESRDVLAKAILKGSQLVEKVQNVVSFVATEDIEHKGNLSVGCELSFLCMQYTPVAHGFLLWTRSYCDGDEFAASAAFATLTPGILSMCRIIAKHHPFSRPEVLDITIMFLKHYNSELDYQKMKTLKEQCLRLLLFLTTQGLAIEVYDFITKTLKEGRNSHIDPLLLRYFVGGVLTIVRPPVSVPFVRSMGGMLCTKNAMTALNTDYFKVDKKVELVKLIGYFSDAVADDKAKFSKATEADCTLVSSLKASYVKENLLNLMTMMKKK